MRSSDMKRRLLAGSATMLGLLLSGCGGGGGVASAPPPTYTKLADLTGNQSFQSAGIQYKNVYGSGTLSEHAGDAFGRGVHISYTAADDSYTLTAPDGATTSFSPSTSTPPCCAAPTPNMASLFTGADVYSRTTPIVNGVTLSYILLGDWSHTIQPGVSRNYVFVAGIPTISSDMPKNGTATYQTSIDGSAETYNGLSYRLASASTATFSANFSAGTVSTTLDLTGVVPGNPNLTPFGKYSGTGTISSGGSGFTGTLTQDVPTNPATTGAFSGAFFGPQAKEVGYAWFVTNPALGGLRAQGYVIGVK